MKENFTHQLRASLFALAATLSLACAADPNAPITLGDYQPPIRVACLGDSITFGVGAGAGQSWPDQLQRMLGDSWDVRNFGHSGASVAKEEKHTIWSQKEYANALLFHPDVAIILLGTNDTKPENWAAKEQFPKLYKNLVASFAELSSSPRVFCGTPPYVAKKGAFGINEASVIEQIPMIERLAKETKSGVIDVHAATDKHDEWFKDNVHPNADGASAIAKAVYRTLTGNEWQGEIPAASREDRIKPTIRSVANPGALSYRELFALIASETTMPRELMNALRERFENTEPEVEAKILEFEDRIAAFESLRMKYKHSTVEAEKPLYGEYKAKGAEAAKELARYRNRVNADLVAAIPAAHRSEFGAAWLARYVFDRFVPIATTLTSEQRKKIREVCQRYGADYAKITNTPERSIMDAAVLKESFERVLDAEQKKRVESK